MKDLQKLAVIYENSGSAQLPSVRRRLRELEPRIQVSQEKEKAEMVSKLKDLGNNLLGMGVGVMTLRICLTLNQGTLVSPPITSSLNLMDKVDIL
jgi:hypothetical protein